MTRMSPFAFAAAIFATGLSVMASSQADAATAHVRYGDLDLGTDAGRATLDSRIARAAHTACWIENNSVSAAEACRRESVANAHETLRHATQAQAVVLAAR